MHYLYITRSCSLQPKPTNQGPRLSTPHRCFPAKPWGSREAGKILLGEKVPEDDMVFPHLSGEASQMTCLLFNFDMFLLVATEGFLGGCSFGGVFATEDGQWKLCFFFPIISWKLISFYLGG